MKLKLNIQRTDDRMQGTDVGTGYQTFDSRMELTNALPPALNPQMPLRSQSHERSHSRNRYQPCNRSQIPNRAQIQEPYDRSVSSERPPVQGFKPVATKLASSQPNVEMVGSSRRSHSCAPADHLKEVTFRSPATSTGPPVNHQSRSRDRSRTLDSAYSSSYPSSDHPAEAIAQSPRTGDRTKKYQSRPESLRPGCYSEPTSPQSVADIPDSAYGPYPQQNRRHHRDSDKGTRHRRRGLLLSRFNLCYSPNTRFPVGFPGFFFYTPHPPWDRVFPVYRFTPFTL